MPDMPQTIEGILWLAVVGLVGLVAWMGRSAINAIRGEIKDMKERLTLSAKRNEEQGKQITDLAQQMAATAAASNERNRTMEAVVDRNSDVMNRAVAVMDATLEVLQDARAEARALRAQQPGSGIHQATG